MKPVSKNRSITDYWSKSSKSSKSSQVESTFSGASELLTAHPGDTATNNHNASNNQSFTSSSSTNKRVVYNGFEHILDSDDSSDASLEDLTDFNISHRSKIPPKSRPLPNELNKKTNNDMKWKHDLDALLRDAQMDQNRKQRIADLEMKLQEDGTASRISHEVNLETTERLLISVLSKDGENGIENAKRTMEAINRTELFQYEQVFHFFNESLEDDISFSPFPLDSVPSDSWATPLLDDDQRESAFLSGYVSKIALLRPLPSEWIQWILQEICMETRHDLALSYKNTIISITQNFPNPLNQDLIINIFLMLRSRQVMLGSVQIVSERSVIVSELRPVTNNLYVVLDLIHQTAKTIPSPTSTYIIQRLLYMSIDHTISHTSSLSQIISKTIASLISCIPDEALDQSFSTLIQTTFSTINSTFLRAQLIHNLPTNPSRAHEFRRRLALSFALNSIIHTLPPKSICNPALSAHIILAVQNAPQYNTSPSSDFYAVIAAFQILDVAIDNGFILAPLTTLNPKSTLVSASTSVPASASTSTNTTTTTTSISPSVSTHIPTPTLTSTTTTTAKSKSKSKSKSKDPSASNLIKSHDDAIDHLAEILSDIAKGIVMAGATHLSRIEARHAIERLANRLSMQVRCRKTVSKNWFAILNSSLEAERRGMREWVGSGV